MGSIGTKALLAGGARRLVIGLLAGADGEAVALAAIGWAAVRPDVDVITLDVPGSHGSLRPLLESGFRIMDQNLFCSSDPGRFGDPMRYIPITPAVY